MLRTFVLRARALTDFAGASVQILDLIEAGM
jgi:hypothetical protein